MAQRGRLARGDNLAGLRAGIACSGKRERDERAGWFGPERVRKHRDGFGGRFHLGGKTRVRCRPGEPRFRAARPKRRAAEIRDARVAHFSRERTGGADGAERREAGSKEICQLARRCDGQGASSGQRQRGCVSRPNGQSDGSTFGIGPVRRCTHGFRNGAWCERPRTSERRSRCACSV